MNTSVPHNPASFFLRLINAFAFAACGYFLFVLAVDISNYSSDLNFWHLIYAIPFLIISGLAAIYALGIKNPTRSHLSFLVAVGCFVGIAWFYVLGQQFLEWLLIPKVADLTGQLLLWPSLALLLIVGVAVDWQLGKAVGFIPRSELWWRETNIRGLCVFLGWLFFFASTNLQMTAEESAVFNIPDHSAVLVLIFPASVFLAVLIGKGLPRLIMSLTGIQPAPPVPRRRRKGFHLWQSTEPIPPSASTESTP